MVSESDKSGKTQGSPLLENRSFGTGSVKERLLGYTFASPAEYAIVPLQDILGLGREGHMNTPGTVARQTGNGIFLISEERRRK